MEGLLEGLDGGEISADYSGHGVFLCWEGVSFLLVSYLRGWTYQIQ